MKLLQKFIFGLLLFNEVICTACSINTPTCTKFIWCSYYRSLIDTLASEVKCLRVIKRRDLSNERNTFKSRGGGRGGQGGALAPPPILNYDNIRSIIYCRISI